MELNNELIYEDELSRGRTKESLDPHYIRGIFIILAVLYSLFIILDRHYYPNHIINLIIIRFGIVVPLLLSVVALTYTKHFVALHQKFMSVSFIVGGLGIVYMLLLDPSNTLYYAGLFMVYFSGYFLIRLKVLYASISGIIIFIGYFLGQLWMYHTLTQVAIYTMIFLISANIIGMHGAYNYDRMMEKQSIHNKKISEANALLRQQIEEKREQLERIETSIRENELLKSLNKEKDELTETLRKSEETYRLLTTQMQLGLAYHEMIFDENGKPIDYRFLHVNDSFEQLTGLNKNDILGKTLLEVLPNTEYEWIEKYAYVAKTGEPLRFERYSKEFNRHYRIFAYAPKIGQFAVVIDDITSIKELEEELYESNQKLYAIFDKSPVSIEFYDAQGCHLYSNEAALELFGVIEPEELKGTRLLNNPNLDSELLNRIGNFETIKVEIDYDFEKVKQYQVYKTRKSGQIILNLSITPLMKNDQLSGYIIHTEDITIERQEQKRIEYLSYHDYMTDLYNRRYFVHAYNRLIEAHQFPLGMMMIDINGLKIINDAYGHAYGDIAIKRVANILSRVFHKDSTVARIGGDEFAVICPNKNSLDMQAYKESIIANLIGNTVGNIEISLAIGYEVIEDHDKDIDDLLSEAENYLYRHKITVGSSVRNHAIKAILSTLTDKYADEKKHSERVSQYCKKIGYALKLSREDIELLGLAGMYHDIGKISIPDAILNKPGKLTSDEFNIIKTHTQIGYQILKAADEYSGLAEYALSHHERWDGKGYPKGLKELEIPLFSRVISVADSFEAMTADRPYRKGMSIEEAIKELRRCAGTQFDPKIVDLFIEHCVYEDNKEHSDIKIHTPWYMN